jgi:hypothetical protein
MSSDSQSHSGTPAGEVTDKDKFYKDSLLDLVFLSKTAAQYDLAGKYLQALYAASSYGVELVASISEGVKNDMDGSVYPDLVGRKAMTMHALGNISIILQGERVNAQNHFQSFKFHEEKQKKLKEITEELEPLIKKEQEELKIKKEETE